MAVDHESLWRALEKVIDPEIGVSVTEMDLIDEVEVIDSQVQITFHLSMPFCPEVFALMIAQDIKNRVEALPGVEKATVILKDHVAAEEINRKVNKVA